MLAVYSLLFRLFLPFIYLRLAWRGLKVPALWLRWGERLGYYRQAPVNDVIWVHAVSVGEAEAIFPLVKKMQERYPNQQFVVTTMTATGSARVLAVLGDSVIHVYLPYDTPGAVKRFFEHFRPKLALIMETELWPNLFAVCHSRHIPLIIINARLSPKSVPSYQRLAIFIRPILAHVNLIAAQTELDAQRFIQIGANPERVKIIGNIKFDIPPMESLIAQGRQLKRELFKHRYVWIVASTHKHEEQYFIEVFRELKSIAPDILLMLVPRHPERFTEVKNLCQNAGLSVVMRTALLQQARIVHEDVYLADTLGELKMLYAAADLAFVGGSLVPVGGHNVLEPAAVGVPVMFGGYMTHFTEIADGLLEAEAAVQCQDQQALLDAFRHLYSDQDFRQRLIANASIVVNKNRGSSEIVLGLLHEYLASNTTDITN